jgi:hypothetical protein
MIYVLHIRQIAPGKMNEYRQLEVNEMEPLFKRAGMRVMGHFNTMIGNSNETVALHAYDSLAQYEKVRETQLTDPDFQKMAARLNALTTSSNSRFLTPSEWSPMK